METLTLPVVYRRPELIAHTSSTYCPGCTHGIINRLAAEVIEELGLRERSIGVASVGCSVFIYEYFDMDFVQAPHGRAPALATGLKRVLPHRLVFTYQGDGDLASIGTGEIIHAAARGENITVIFVNNAVYGMTGGQMAPTTLAGMKTTTSPQGRDVKSAGFPLKVSELLASLTGPAYIVRRSVHNPGHINQTKKALRTAFRVQQAELGFSMVEVLSACPVNWGLSPQEALKFVEERMLPTFPLGDYKVIDAVQELL